MKLKIVLVFLIINNLIHSQDFFRGEVKFTTSINYDSINIAKNYKDHKNYEFIKKKTLDILKTANELSYKLNFNKNESLFVNEDKLQNEDKVNLIEILGGKGVYYVNNIENVILHQNEFMGDLFLVEVGFMEWELIQENKKIGNYLCYKAKGVKIIENSQGIIKKPIIAWYSIDLPFNFGPKGYCGLPGLILEVQEGKLNIVASKIELNTKEAIIIEKPKLGKKVTEEEFKQITKDAASKFFKGK
jgi:GLPGLI family protein